MKSLKTILRASLLGAASLIIACPGVEPPPPLLADVTIDVNGNTGDTIIDAFFGIGSIENQPLFESEDIDGDGNLDVFEDVDFDNRLDVAEDVNGNNVLDNGEDLDGDGNLDIAEDVDGDGVLDFNNEDTNANGTLDNIQTDINGDGILNADDNVTQTFFILASSSGELGCDFLVEALQSNEDPLFNGTLFATIGVQLGFAPNIPNAFASGQTITASQVPPNITVVQSLFGNFENGVAVNNSNAASDEQNNNISLQITTLADTLTATVTGDVVDDAAVVIPFTASFNAAPECAALSAELQLQLESGQLFN